MVAAPQLFGAFRSLLFQKPFVSLAVLSQVAPILVVTAPLVGFAPSLKIPWYLIRRPFEPLAILNSK